MRYYTHKGMLLRVHRYPIQNITLIVSVDSMKPSSEIEAVKFE